MTIDFYFVLRSNLRPLSITKCFSFSLDNVFEKLLQHFRVMQRKFHLWIVCKRRSQKTSSNGMQIRPLLWNGFSCVWPAELTDHLKRSIRWKTRNTFVPPCGMKNFPNTHTHAHKLHEWEHQAHSKEYSARRNRKKEGALHSSMLCQSRGWSRRI